MVRYTDELVNSLTFGWVEVLPASLICVYAHSVWWRQRPCGAANGALDEEAAHGLTPYGSALRSDRPSRRRQEEPSRKGSGHVFLILTELGRAKLN
jgi:hypothetical protein